MFFSQKTCFWPKNVFLGVFFVVFAFLAESLQKRQFRQKTHFLALFRVKTHFTKMCISQKRPFGLLQILKTPCFGPRSLLRPFGAFREASKNVKKVSKSAKNGQKTWIFRFLPNQKFSAKITFLKFSKKCQNLSKILKIWQKLRQKRQNSALFGLLEGSQRSQKVSKDL